MTETAVRLVLVDDHAVVREGVKRLLELDGFAEIVGVTASAEEALAVLRHTPCDVVVLDVALPRDDGITCAKKIRAAHPQVRILMLSMHAEAALVADALNAGASGYVLKSAPVDDVKRAIMDVHAGHTYVEPRLAGALLHRGPTPPTPQPAPSIRLSGREMQVLQLMARGQSNPTIADALGLTVNTVKAHVKSLYRKLEVNSRVAVVTSALKQGLVVPPV